MITKKLHSLFLFVIAVLLCCNCKDNNENNIHAAEVATINQHLKKALLTQNAPESRFHNASQAYEAAIKLDSAYLIWQTFTVAYPLLQQHFPQKADSFLRSYKHDALLKEDTVNIANAYFETGKSFDASGKSDSAYYYYNASRNLYEAKNDSLGTVEKLVYMAKLHYTFNDYAEFESTTTEAFQLMHSKPKTAIDSAYLTIAYNNYGLAYTALYEYENALRYYQKALAFKDRTYQASIKNNIALVHMQHQEYAKAIAILKPLLNSKTLTGHTELRARVLDNLGYSLFRTGNKTALEFLKASLAVRKQQGVIFELIPSNIHLSEYYQTVDTRLARTYALKAYDQATALHSVDDRLAALKKLSRIPGQDQQRFSAMYIQIKDSIDEVRQKARNQFAKIKYDSKMAQEENQLLKTQKAEDSLEIQQKTNRMLLLLIVVILAIGVIIYTILQIRAQRRKAVYETETRIAKRLHDELANDVHHTMAFSETQDMTIPENKETLQQYLEGIYKRTRNISRENSEIDTGENYPKVLMGMVSDYQSPTLQIMVNGFDHMPWQLLGKFKKITIHRILQEWLVNMKKHSSSTVVFLQFELQGKCIKINYADNGIGTAQDKVILKSGLQNVENRIQAIKGTLTFGNASGTGFKASVIFPI